MLSTLLLSIGQPLWAQQTPEKEKAAAFNTRLTVKEVTDRVQTTVPAIMREAGVPGLSMALIRDRKVVWRHGFGVKNAKTKDPVDDATVFEAASLSKPVFAYAVLKLVESGKLDLDAPLTKYLPDPYVPDEPRLNLITARRVLTHSTGFPNWRGGQPLKINFTPGERFSYSGEGFVYLQKAVEHVTGKPLNELARELVFSPLGMTSSSYVWEDRYETLKAYSHNSSGAVAGRNKPDEANAAASLHTTATDYATFMAAILDHKGLTETMVREMLQPQIKVDENCAVCFNRAAGKLSAAISWGLGVGLYHGPEGDAFWHWGDNGNTMAYMVAYPGKKLGVVVFMNSADGLSLADEVVYQALGVHQPQLTWTHTEPYNSPGMKVFKDILKRGQVAITEYKQARKDKKSIALPESRMNTLGYLLIAKGRTDNAIEIFKMNVDDFPDSWNAYDSLGEAYFRAGDDAQAIKNYQRSLELNPKNTSASTVLDRIEHPKVAVDAKLLESYVGKYHDDKFGTLMITKTGNHLWGSVEEDSDAPAELIPKSADRFSVPAAQSEVRFVTDGNGGVAYALIKAGKDEIKAIRVQ
ncbi:MAG TPA: serine hydrolase [Candidatus Angelobacter sp.]